MPDLMTSTALKGATTTSQFHFSGQKVAELQGASEYTLACITVDRSGSVGGFKTLIEKAYATAVKACRKSPRAHNLLLRGATFSDDVVEMHGFVALSQLDEDKVAIDPDGYTALYDATLDGIESIEGYADTLVKNDFFVNGILVIVTDGGENHSRKATLEKIRAALTRVGKAEKLESVKTILIGVGDQASVKTELENFQKDAGLDQFIWVGDATPQRLAKMAEFVSKSISSASLSLGTGGPSQNLSLN